MWTCPVWLQQDFYANRWDRCVLVQSYRCSYGTLVPCKLGLLEHPLYNPSAVPNVRSCTDVATPTGHLLVPGSCEIFGRKLRFSFGLWSSFLMCNASAAKFDSDAETAAEFTGIWELASGRNLHMVKTRNGDKWYTAILLLISRRNTAYCQPLRWSCTSLFSSSSSSGYIVILVLFCLIVNSKPIKEMCCLRGCFPLFQHLLTWCCYHREKLALSTEIVQQILPTWILSGSIKKKHRANASLPEMVDCNKLYRRRSFCSSAFLWVLGLMWLL